MNVLQVTPDNVYPPSGGGQHRSHGLVSEFPRSGDTVARFAQGGPLKNYAKIRLRTSVSVGEQYQEYRHQHPLSEVARVPTLWGYPEVFLDYPLRYSTPTILRSLVSWADLLLVDFPWQLPVIASLVGGKPVIYSSHNVEYERFSNLEDKPLGRWFRNRVRKREQAAVDAADGLVCTSSRDASLFRELYSVEIPTIVAPNGVEIPDSATLSDRAPHVRRKHDISDNALVSVFVGTQYEPNIEAARELLDIAGKLPEKYQFIIVGAVGDKLTNPPPNVSVTGHVENLVDYYLAADVGLNPVSFGSGTNIKLLEYFAHRLPVISTPFGVRGLELSSETVISCRRQELGAALRELADDPNRRERLAANGYEFVRTYHSWSEISRSLREELYDQFG